jgi:hypothetical protein
MPHSKREREVTLTSAKAARISVLIWRAGRQHHQQMVASLNRGANLLAPLALVLNGRKA